ncbi:NAD(P)-dependent oxidoreductase [Actinocrispum sp. NPDC049592]|uniref:NAD(P)-dependent oxidoreductase n=1 Tax=Actinocrispum sp. NPDC049592 TaxID=3154835 RepID=UPI0034438F20
MRVALLGTGTMGAGMARNIARAGIPLRVWNRSRERAEPLAEHGIEIAATPAEAVDGADLVITMLFDAASVEEAMKDVRLGPDTVWAQMSTVGVQDTARLAATTERFVDAPVLGTKQPAEQGTLLVVASGAEEFKPVVTPVFDAVGSRTMWVGDEPGPATKLKLVVNGWMGYLIAGTGQSMSFAEALGLDPALFLEAINGAASDSMVARLKGSAIIKDDFTPSFSLDGAVKDMGLIADAMRDAGVDTSVADAVGGMMRKAQDLGHGEKDMISVYHAFK